MAHPDCAGSDAGSASHFVSVPPDRDDIRLVNVISDIVGETGQRIVRGIVAGELTAIV